MDRCSKIKIMNRKFSFSVVYGGNVLTTCSSMLPIVELLLTTRFKYFFFACRISQNCFKHCANFLSDFCLCGVHERHNFLSDNRSFGYCFSRVRCSMGKRVPAFYIKDLCFIQDSLLSSQITPGGWRMYELFTYK